MENKSERDFLNYTSNKFPRVLRFIWTIFAVFAVYYLVAYALPDLMVWLKGSGS